MPATAGWLGVLAVSGLAGIYVAAHPFWVLGLSLAVLLLGISIVNPRKSKWATGHYRWIPPAWIALAFFADHRLGGPFRSPLAAAEGQLSFENGVQLLVYALVGLLVLRERGALLREDRRSIRKGFLIAWPSIALISTFWSIIPRFTAIRAIQLFIVISLGLLCVRIWLSSPDMGRLLMSRALRLFVQLVTLLAISGFLLGEAWRVRYAWFGANAITAATYAGIAFLILAVGGKVLTGFSAPIYWSQLFLFGSVLYFARTRSVIIAVYVAILAGIWLWGRRNIMARYAGLAYSALATLALLLLTRQELLVYLSRGESTQSLESLNGRVPLWTATFQDLTAAGKWPLGFGYGSARAILPTEVEWAGTAHNSWIELLFGIGIVGVLVAAASFAFLLYQLYQTRSVDPTHRLAFAVVALLLVASGAASEAFAIPGMGFTFIVLFSSLVIAERESESSVPSLNRSKQSRVSWGG
jgi:hypothetical protein